MRRNLLIAGMDAIASDSRKEQDVYGWKRESADSVYGRRGKGTERMDFIKRKRRNIYKLMILPAVILYSVFFLYPLTQGIGISLTDWDGVSTPHFIGVQNFVRFFHDGRARQDVLHTLQYGLITPLLMNIVGFLYALLLDQELRGVKIVRVIVYLPAVVSSLIIGYIWQIVLRPDGGALHDIMNFLGMGGLFQNWLSMPAAAMNTIIAINVWQNVGSVMIIYLAGMQSIPSELMEVSCIDGADYWQRVRYVLLPLLIPSMKINIITNIINSLAVFDSVIALTKGGPGYHTETLSIFIYRMSFGTKTGYATAVAVILFVIIMIPAVAALRILAKKEVEM